MWFKGIEFNPGAPVPLDKDFVPLGAFFAAHQQLARQPFALALERERGLVSVWRGRVIGDAAHREADLYFLERLAKFLLYSRGGWRLCLCGAPELAGAVAGLYTPGGARDFDCRFMRRVYDKDFTVECLAYEACPPANEDAQPLGRHLDGCRIGFDAGGSDRKVSAVIDGEPVYSEEVVWHPKENANPDYHYAGILEAFRTAAAHLPRVDAIGVSSAGVFIDNICKSASLFIKVEEDAFNAKARDIYIRAAAEIGHVPVAVANDGDVTALAGSMGLGDGEVLGIAMGTSEAAGYVEDRGYITGWLNELAFAPLDGNPAAMQDEWSGDIGCGVKYLSQDGVVKLARAAGMALEGATQAERLREVQAKAEADDPLAQDIFRSIGVYLGHALGLYHQFYAIRHVLMLGRVTSGKGGDLLLETAQKVLRDHYPDCPFTPQAPDEQTRRVGQSVAAASLPGW